MPKLSTVTGYIAFREHRNGWQWMIFVLAAKTDQAEIIGDRIYKRQHNARRAAEIWAKRLGIVTS